MQEKVQLEQKFINHPNFKDWESYQVFSSVEGSVETLSYIFDINPDTYIKVTEIIQPMQETLYDVLLYHAEVGMSELERNVNTTKTLEEIEHQVGVLR